MGESKRQSNSPEGVRWMLIECPRCGRPRDVNIYRIILGYMRCCLACSRAENGRKAGIAARARARRRRAT